MRRLKHRVRSHARALLAFCTALSAPAPSASEVRPHQVEAAFLLNFTKFIEWPADAFEAPESPFEICIWGDDPFGGSLEREVKGETVVRRRIAIRHVGRPHGAKSCHILFVAASPKNIAPALSDLGPGVLTVSDRPNFLEEGGIIAFVLEGRHVRFDINQRAASKASLTISAKLLNVARSVQK